MDDNKPNRGLRLEEMDGLMTFLQSIEWKDPWLLALIMFHILVALVTVLTRNHGNFQVMLFLVLLLLVYFSENINELASNNWNLFSRQQYFDSKGVFISLVFSAPILLNCMVLVASWLYQSSELMAKLKRAQLQQARLKAKRADQSPTTVSDILNKFNTHGANIKNKETEMDATGLAGTHFKDE